MKTGAINKIRKLGTGGKVLSIIGFVILSIGLAAVLAGWITATALVPKDFRVDVTSVNEISFGGEMSARKSDIMLGLIEGFIGQEGAMETTEQGFRFKGIDGQFTVTYRHIQMVCLITTLLLVILMIPFWFAIRLSQALSKCDSPFEPLVIRRMTHFSYALIPILFIGNGDINGLTKFRWQFHFNLESVLLVIALFALIQIFKYGAVLQQESDETL